jgi:protein-disulfide isomerase
MRDSGELLQEFTHRMATLQIVDEILERNASAPKARRAIHHIRIAHDDWFSHNLFILASETAHHTRHEIIEEAFMIRFSISILFLTAVLLTAADEWQTATTLPGVDLSKLTPKQKTAALAGMREEGCPCGCDLKVAQCRVVDPNCALSRRLAAKITIIAASGKTVPQIRGEMAKASQIPIQGAPSRGPANAKITLVEFSDFQCPYCSVAIHHINALLKAYPNDIRLVFKQFPLEMHDEAKPAAEAALAANDQGKFWEMHDKLYANFKQLNKETIDRCAKEIGLDMDRFHRDLASGKYAKVVDRDTEDGFNAGVGGTPTFFINNKRYNDKPELESLKPVIDQILKASR